MIITGHGLTMDLPTGWEGRIYQRPEATPILHAANFGLPPVDGDFASGAVGAMPEDGVLIVLAQYQLSLSGQGLFRPGSLPIPMAAMAFRARAMQRRVPGRLGLQRFFTVQTRPFSLYVVTGTKPSRGELVDRANRVLSTLVIEAPP